MVLALASHAQKDALAESDLRECFLHSYNINIPIIIVQNKITHPKFLNIESPQKGSIVMYNKKNRRIMTTVLVVILVLAMVVPLLISAIS